MGERFAIKRLANVEVRPKTSHQHEFNGGALRRGLGFTEETVRGPLTIQFYTSDEPPVVEESSYTLYNARSAQTHRSAEYRLYYTSPLVSRLAHPGDLLVLYRESGSSLHAVVARPGTAAERDLQSALLADQVGDIRRFFFVTTPSTASLEAGLELASSLFPAPATDLPRRRLSELVESSQTLKDALSARRIPPTREMADAARRLVLDAYGPLDGDDFLISALEAETALYFEIETRLGDAELRAMDSSGELSFANVIRLTQRFHQSRKARRGLSLQHHFADLLDENGIPYDSPCVTEGKEKPDFIIPGCREYHDQNFPAARLRMVACKSRTRERWDQVLNEAARIPTKYLLTVDEDLTDDLIRTIVDSGIRVFMPKRVLETNYANSKRRELLGTVEILLADLLSVI